MIREDRKPADTYDCSNLRGWQPLTFVPDGDTLRHVDWQPASGGSSTPSVFTAIWSDGYYSWPRHRHDQYQSWNSQSYHGLQVTLPRLY